MNLQPLRSFRLVCAEQEIHLVEDLLAAEGFSFSKASFSLWARELLHEPFPLGSSLAATFGYIYIQDRSSMLPPLALNPPAGSAVLDMCASPGSKTSLLAQLTGKQGFILANEPTPSRLGTLRRNLSSMNLLQCATMCFPGETIPLRPGTTQGQTFQNPGWDYILLDPPCSGWGTVEKNPQVLELWKGDKIKPLVLLQRQLLQKAWQLLNPGGHVVYSTCTTNTAENEEQLAFACDELGFELVPLTPFEGIEFRGDLPNRFTGALAVPTGPATQGFFITLLRKPQIVAAHTNESTCSVIPDFTKNTSAPLVSKANRNDKPVFTVEYLDPAALRSELVCPELLPHGKLGVFNGTIHFLPAASEQLLPERFNWKGFPVGKIQGAKIKIYNGLRTLMPKAQDTSNILNIDEPDLISALISGQSIACQSTKGALGLYYKDLPLCRLAVKGKRAILPPLM